MRGVRRLLIGASLSACAAAMLAAPASGAVLQVGTYHGISGAYSTIQSAVNAAQPGDWILVAPGDYKEANDGPGQPQRDGDIDAGVLVTTPDVHIRGMDRNSVVIDGTNPGAPECSSAPADQDFGALDGGDPVGRNGLVDYKADGDSFENLTVCNFLSSGDGGNEIWWNGGDGSGHIGLGAYSGAYLSATTTFYGDGQPAGEYGIFVSDSRGPGEIDHTYASNMNDSSYYIGACPDCNAVVSDAHAENSALGYSGTNSGGHLIIQNSEWDQNNTGIVTNSQNNDDAPSPQNGACPPGQTGPTGTASCTVFRDNYIHDNNNPNVPQAGAAALGPVGTGLVLAGGENDIVTGNTVTDNGAWGIIVTPYPDTETPPPIANCNGGAIDVPGVLCYFSGYGNEIEHNMLGDNGFFGNPGDADLADITEPHLPGNCWHDNSEIGGGTVTTAPLLLETTHATCGGLNLGDLAGLSGIQLVCETGAILPVSCPSTPISNYPRPAGVSLKPLPPQPTMPDPCAGVPSNSWCSAPAGTTLSANQGGAGKKKRKHHRRKRRKHHRHRRHRHRR